MLGERTASAWGVVNERGGSVHEQPRGGLNAPMDTGLADLPFPVGDAEPWLAAAAQVFNAVIGKMVTAVLWTSPVGIASLIAAAICRACSLLGTLSALVGTPCCCCCPCSEPQECGRCLSVLVHVHLLWDILHQIWFDGQDLLGTATQLVRD